MNNKTVRTDLICPECGNIFTIQRRIGNQKKLYHRKWLYCPICQKDTNHIEVKDLDILIEKIARKEEKTRTEDENKVYKLLRRSE